MNATDSEVRPRHDVEIAAASTPSFNTQNLYPSLMVDYLYPGWPPTYPWLNLGCAFLAWVVLSFQPTRQPRYGYRRKDGLNFTAADDVPKVQGLSGAKQRDIAGVRLYRLLKHRSGQMLKGALKFYTYSFIFSLGTARALPTGIPSTLPAANMPEVSMPQAKSPWDPAMFGVGLLALFVGLAGVGAKILRRRANKARTCQTQPDLENGSEMVQIRPPPSEEGLPEPRLELRPDTSEERDLGEMTLETIGPAELYAPFLSSSSSSPSTSSTQSRMLCPFPSTPTQVVISTCV